MHKIFLSFSLFSSPPPTLSLIHPPTHAKIRKKITPFIHAAVKKEKEKIEKEKKRNPLIRRRRPSLCIKPILGRILDLKGSSLSHTRLGSSTSNSINPIDFLKGTIGIIRLTRKFQPRHGALEGILGGIGTVSFLESALGVIGLPGIVAFAFSVEVEVGGGEIGEVVMTGDFQEIVDRDGDGDFDVLVLVGPAGEAPGEGRRHGSQAGGVDESGNCSCCSGDGGGVGEVAGVILRTASDGDVVEGEAGRDGRKRFGGYFHRMISIKCASESPYVKNIPCGISMEEVSHLHCSAARAVVAARKLWPFRLQLS